MLASEPLLSKAVDDVAAVSGAVTTSDRLRSLLLDQTAPELSQEARAQLQRPELPPTEWRTYDHCAAVTRLYALFEGFVDSLLRHWLDSLPGLLDSYQDLLDGTRTEHVKRVGRLLTRLDWTRYAHLSVERTIDGLYRAVRGEPYELLPEAFLIREANLGPEEVTRVFATCQVPNAWNWVEAHPEVHAFLQEERPGQNASAELKLLLNYRNEAAHGTVTQILGTHELEAYCRLVRSICIALKELVDNQHLERLVAIGAARVVGSVTEDFTHDAVVAKVVGEFAIGDTLYGRRSTECSSLELRSLQLNGVPAVAVNLEGITELGMLFNRRVREGTELLVVGGGEVGTAAAR